MPWSVFVGIVLGALLLTILTERKKYLALSRRQQSFEENTKQNTKCISFSIPVKMGIYIRIHALNRINLSSFFLFRIPQLHPFPPIYERACLYFIQSLRPFAILALSI